MKRSSTAILTIRKQWRPLWFSAYRYILHHKRRIIQGSFPLVLVVWFTFCLPASLFKAPTCLVLEDSQGNLLGAKIASDQQWRFPPGSLVPKKFEIALITAEDKRYAYHPGVDPLALIRAMRQNWKANRSISGGSTITMQVIRLSRHKPRTYGEKFLEILLALRLEFSQSKSSIVRLYAENAPFGSNIVGLEAASWRYYGRSAQNLSWAESCTLALLPNNPSYVRPGKNQARLLKKRNELMRQLAQQKTISSETYQLGLKEPLPGAPKPLPQWAPHFLEYIHQKMGNQGASLIRTPIQKELQIHVTGILQNQLPRLQANYIHNAAVLVLSVETGAVLAYVGNILQTNKPEMQSQVDLIQAPRSPGSTLKPLLYASMLQDGIILPHALVADVPTNYAGYTPQNFDLGYDGALAASSALSRSLNVPMVRMLNTYTYPRFYDQLKRLGLTTLNHPADFYGLSLILGGEEVTLWDLCGVYANLARIVRDQKKLNSPLLVGQPGAQMLAKNATKAMGANIHPPVFSVASVNNPAKGTTSSTSSDMPTSGALWYAFQAMEEVQRPGDEALWRTWASSQRIAWKTGTSFGYRDAWAVGVTPNYVVGVWVGNSNGEGRPGIIGLRAAAPILFSVFSWLPPAPWFKFPFSDCQPVRVCKKTGFRAGENCPETQVLEVPRAGLGSPVCPYHMLVHLNTQHTFRTNADCIPEASMIHESWFVLPPTMEYFYRLKNPGYLALPPFLPGCPTGIEESSPLDMIYPENEAKLYVPYEFDGKRGKVIFKASQRGNAGKLYWHLDKEYIGSTDRFHEMSLDPSPGKHRLTLEDERGNIVERSFEILEPSFHH